MAFFAWGGPIVSQGSVAGTLRTVISPLNGAYVYYWRIALAPAAYVQTAPTTGGRVNVQMVSVLPGEWSDVEANGYLNE